MLRSVGLANSHEQPLLPTQGDGGLGSPSKRARREVAMPRHPLARLALCCLALVACSLLIASGFLPEDPLGIGGEAEQQLDRELALQEQEEALREQEESAAKLEHLRGNNAGAEAIDRWFHRKDDGLWSQSQPTGRPYTYAAPGVLAVAVDSAKQLTVFRLAVHPRPGAQVSNVDKLYRLTLPPAHQVPPPFGCNFGGMPDELLKVHPEAAYDSWLTIGSASGGGAFSSKGLEFAAWNSTHGLSSDSSAVFFMKPGASSPVVDATAVRGVTVAQLTVPTGQGWRAEMSCQGRLEQSVDPEKDGWSEGLVFEVAEAKPAVPAALPLLGTSKSGQHSPVGSGGAKVDRAVAAVSTVQTEGWRRGRVPAGVGASAATLSPTSCDDGKTSLPLSHINDDYCDCKDHSDEPGTSACSQGSDGMLLGGGGGGPGFYCGWAQESAQAAADHGLDLTIFASRVNDGVCDCCDGADEWSSITADNSAPTQCADTCGAALAVSKARKRVFAEGSKLRAALYVPAGNAAKLGQSSELDGGPQNAYLALKGKCFEWETDVYTYSVCPYGAYKPVTLCSCWASMAAAFNLI